MFGKKEQLSHLPRIRHIVRLSIVLSVFCSLIVFLSPLSASAQVNDAARPGPSICYQAHVQNIGWQGTVCNNAVAGTTGQSLRMEAIRIFLRNVPRFMSVCYQAHVQNIGWQRPVCNGAVAGTTGQSLRMEAIRIFLVRGFRTGVCYQAHVQNIGWQSRVCNGNVAGTTGQSLRMEAIKIQLR